MTALDDLLTAPRLLLEAELRPLVGSTFQPTGFPNLGAATFKRGEQSMLIVESVQSMANHLEAIGWDEPARAPAEALRGLPYVEVVHEDDGEHLTSSREEPHRLSSPYVREAFTSDGQEGVDWLVGRLALREGRPLDRGAMHRAVFGLDPLCLIHGVFFSDPKFRGSGNPKLRRATTAVIEAEDAAVAVSGGVKRDDVRPTADADNAATEGYGFVPFGRTEYTGTIRLTAAVDLQQLAEYRLDPRAVRLMQVIALWQLAELLERPLRLRTRCDLEMVNLTVRKPAEAALPTAADLRAELDRLVAAHQAEPVVLRWLPRKDRKRSTR